MSFIMIPGLKPGVGQRFQLKKGQTTKSMRRAERRNKRMANMALASVNRLWKQEVR